MYLEINLSDYGLDLTHYSGDSVNISGESDGSKIELFIDEFDMDEIVKSYLMTKSKYDIEELIDELKEEFDIVEED